MNYLHFYTTSEHNFPTLDLHPQQKQNYSQDLCIVKETWIAELLNRKHKLQGGLVWKGKWWNKIFSQFPLPHLLCSCWTLYFSLHIHNSKQKRKWKAVNRYLKLLITTAAFGCFLQFWWLDAHNVAGCVT